MLINNDPKYCLSLKRSIGNLYSLIYDEIIEIFESIGEPLKDYEININPLSIKRIDGKCVPKIVQTQIKNMF